MTKRITYIAIVLLMAIPVQAQFSWGVKGGVNLGNSDLTMLAKDPSALDLSNCTGFFVGPKFEVRIPVLGFGMETAVLYAQKGMALADKDIFRQNSLQIPLNVKYSFGIGNKANIFVAAGPEFTYNAGETEALVNTLVYGDDSSKPTGGEIKAYVIQKSALNMNIGLGVTLFDHLQVGVNYNIPWGKNGDFVYIKASEIENIEMLKNKETITVDNLETLCGTAEKVQKAYNHIKAGTLQVSAAYLF